MANAGVRKDHGEVRVADVLEKVNSVTLWALKLAPAPNASVIAIEMQ
jgi:hypothetical protein